MSVNNIFVHLNESVYKRYKKIVPHMVVGKRPDPDNMRNMIPFVLETDERNFDFETKQIQFVADDETIEVYSEVEDKIFRKENAALFANGILAPYTDTVSLVVESSNELTDTAIEEIARIKTLMQFKSRVAELNEIARKRIAVKLTEFNRPLSFHKVLEND